MPKSNLQSALLPQVDKKPQILKFQSATYFRVRMRGQHTQSSECKGGVRFLLLWKGLISEVQLQHTSFEPSNLP